MLACGHIEPDWPVMTLFRKLNARCYCEACEEWVKIDRGTTPAERAGITVAETQHVLEFPPF